ncbi:hypothetical protein [Streptomonospora salina]|uniref:Uncharacterized protein n=1 Tax=Streptomonospora salina TaxID=104205 RepID=A0A841EJE0_9ACTN|nr:hypothetical protein [Streptomonospora salina]MBB6000470.1 hypothetical protein [Streptomonospora salina]
MTTRPAPVATMIERYNSALDQDFGDHLRFTPVETDDGIMGTGTAARITHSARLGDRPLMDIQTASPRCGGRRGTCRPGSPGPLKPARSRRSCS